MPIIAETQRLILRRFRDSDLQDLHEYLSDADTLRFEPYLPMNLDETREELARRIDAGDMIAVEMKSTGKLIGNIYLSPREFSAWELGYVFNRRFWGQGCAKEACRALIEKTFASGVHRIYAECDPLTPHPGVCWSGSALQGKPISAKTCTSGQTKTTRRYGRIPLCTRC